MKNRLFLFAFMFFCSHGAYAGNFDSLVEQAKTDYNNGNNLQAVQNLKESVLSIWDKVPLTVTNARLVIDTKNYDTRASNIYRSGEPMLIFAQLIGYKLKPVGEMYDISIVTDFYVSDKEGKVLGGLQEFGKFNITSPLPVTDFRLDLTYTLTDAPPGPYRIQTVIHDKNSNKTTKFVQEIRIE